MEYPHWLMVAGAILVVVGFTGLALQKNHAEPAENKQAAPTDEQNSPQLEQRQSGEPNQGLPSTDGARPAGKKPT
jgi:hypothetical protein